MKNTVKTIALIAITSVAVSCSAQNNQTSNNQASSNQKGRQQQGRPPNFTQLLSELDMNKDGKLAKSEVKGPLANDFAKIDTNNDGFISESEHKAAPRPQRSGPRQ